MFRDALEDTPTGVDRSEVFRFRQLRFRFTEKEYPTWLERVMQLSENVLLCLYVEIDQYVTTDHDVTVRDRRITYQVPLTEDNCPPDFASNSQSLLPVEKSLS